VNWKAAREAVDAVGVDGMSGEETDGNISGRQKQLAQVPVRWINSELSHLFHNIDSWKSAITDEGFVNARGNRPFTRSPTIKEPVSRKVTKGLLRNWYDDTWYKSQSDAQKRRLNPTSVRPIPTLVSSVICLCTYTFTELTLQQLHQHPPVI
jgi:hypothetical protein